MKGSSNKKSDVYTHRYTYKGKGQKIPIDAGLIRTDASEENRFLVYRIRPLCHCAFLLDVKRLFCLSISRYTLESLNLYAALELLTAEKTVRNPYFIVHSVLRE